MSIPEHRPGAQEEALQYQEYLTPDQNLFEQFPFAHLIESAITIPEDINYFRSMVYHLGIKNSRNRYWEDSDTQTPSKTNSSFIMISVINWASDNDRKFKIPQNLRGEHHMNAYKIINQLNTTFDRWDEYIFVQNDTRRHMANGMLILSEQRSMNAEPYRRASYIAWLAKEKNIGVEEVLRAAFPQDLNGQTIQEAIRTFGKKPSNRDWQVKEGIPTTVPKT